VDTIHTVTVKIRVDGIDLENNFDKPTIKLDNDEKSLHRGVKCFEESWIPALTITPKNIDKIQVYIK